MIFRRSNKQTAPRNMAKPMTNKAQNYGTSELAARKEPGFVTSSNQPSEQTMSITPPLNNTPMHNNSANAPISPLAAAQARRNPNGPAPANYGRQDQPSKLIVGRDITLNGEIATCDHLVVEGTVTATVKDGQTIEILEKGSFSGQVEIEQADIAGKFNGDLTVRGKLVIRSTAIVIGNIQYGSLQVDHGAVINSTLSALTKTAATETSTTLLHANPAQNNAAQNISATSLPSAANTQTNAANTQNATTASLSMQQNTYLSSVLEQPGFLKSSGQ